MRKTITGTIEVNIGIDDAVAVFLAETPAGRALILNGMASGLVEPGEESEAALAPPANAVLRSGMLSEQGRDLAAALGMAVHLFEMREPMDGGTYDAEYNIPAPGGNPPEQAEEP